MKRKYFLLKESYNFRKTLMKFHHLLMMTPTLLWHTSSNRFRHAYKNFFALTQLTFQHRIEIMDKEVYIGCLLLLRPLTLTGLLYNQPPSLHDSFSMGCLGPFLLIPFSLSLGHDSAVVFQNNKMIVHLLLNENIIYDFCKFLTVTYSQMLH
jgi:hypothetical protein